MRYIHLTFGILIVSIISLFVTTCDKPTSSGIEDTIELFAGLEPISEASNTTIIVNKGEEDSDSYFRVEISGMETNGLLRSGTHGAWCLEWRKPMRSNNDEHKGVKWYSSIGNPKWKPLNYFFSIKGELEAADPDLSFREFQAVVWSLAGYMGIAPEFNLETLPDSELPGDLRTDGQPNFSKRKVMAIVDRVKSEYSSFRGKSTGESGCIVGETAGDQQDVCVPTEPEPGRIEIEPNPIILSYPRVSRSINITVYDENDQVVPDAIVTLSIKDISIASITEGSKSIIINGISTGETILTAESDGITTTIPIIVEVFEINSEKISASYTFSCGLDTNGKAYCWGQNASGQLGNGTTNNSSIPVAVNMPIGVTFSSISAGRLHVIALDENGKAWAWGNNAFGQLGDGTTINQSTPVAVIMPKIAGGGFVSISSGNDHNLALGPNGRAWAWGRNGFGELGHGSSFGTYTSTPVSVSIPEGVAFSSISAGDTHSLAIDEQEKVWAWGHNGQGQLGTGTIENHNTPTEIVMPPGVSITSINGGGYHTLALDSEGNAWTWGWNNWGQLGDGSLTQSNTPIEVTMPDGSSFTKISAGNGHNIVLDSNGKAWGWGWNITGSLGDGTGSNRLIPVEVSILAGVQFTDISAGWDHSLAIDSNGDFWGWGGNGWGQVGDGSVNPRYLPVEVLFPEL